MRKKKAKKEAKPLNLLDLVPVRKVEWKKAEDGLIVLLKPKYAHTFFVKHALPRFKSPNYKIRLDEIGSHIWEACDGKLTVMELGKRLKDKFGAKIEPLFDRLALFIQNMERNRFISYK